MSAYIGRFAPTPSGPLHFGSVVAAVGSYLRARSLGGKIFLRIEDLDTPRCPPANTRSIIEDLSELGFRFDGIPIVQSEHKSHYQKYLDLLTAANTTFYCSCSRASLKTAPCSCYSKHLKQAAGLALKFRYDEHFNSSFKDEILGTVKTACTDSRLTLVRSDGVISYNLACVADDIEEEISEVVRGQDLIDITPRQNALYQALGRQAPAYLHLPLALMSREKKLSKQNHAAPAMALGKPAFILLKALEFLGQDTINLREISDPKKLLEQAVGVFDIQKIPKNSQII